VAQLPDLDDISSTFSMLLTRDQFMRLRLDYRGAIVALTEPAYRSGLYYGDVLVAVDCVDIVVPYRQPTNVLERSFQQMGSTCEFVFRRFDRIEVIYDMLKMHKQVIAAAASSVFRRASAEPMRTEMYSAAPLRDWEAQHASSSEAEDKSTLSKIRSIVRTSTQHARDPRVALLEVRYTQYHTEFGMEQQTPIGPVSASDSASVTYLPRSLREATTSGLLYDLDMHNSHFTRVADLIPGCLQQHYPCLVRVARPVGRRDLIQQIRGIAPAVTQPLAKQILLTALNGSSCWNVAGIRELLTFDESMRINALVNPITIEVTSWVVWLLSECLVPAWAVLKAVRNVVKRPPTKTQHYKSHNWAFRVLVAISHAIRSHEESVLMSEVVKEWSSKGGQVHAVLADGALVTPPRAVESGWTVQQLQRINPLIRKKLQQGELGSSISSVLRRRPIQGTTSCFYLRVKGIEAKKPYGGSLALEELSTMGVNLLGEAFSADGPTEMEGPDGQLLPEFAEATNAQRSTPADEGAVVDSTSVTSTVVSHASSPVIRAECCYCLVDRYERDGPRSRVRFPTDTDCLHTFHLECVLRHNLQDEYADVVCPLCRKPASRGQVGQLVVAAAGKIKHLREYGLAEVYLQPDLDNMVRWAWWVEVLGRSPTTVPEWHYQRPSGEEAQREQVDTAISSSTRSGLSPVEQQETHAGRTSRKQNSPRHLRGASRVPAWEVAAEMRQQDYRERRVQNLSVGDATADEPTAAKRVMPQGEELPPPPPPPITPEMQRAFAANVAEAKRQHQQRREELEAAKCPDRSASSWEQPRRQSMGDARAEAGEGSGLRTEETEAQAKASYDEHQPPVGFLAWQRMSPGQRSEYLQRFPSRRRRVPSAGTERSTAGSPAVRSWSKNKKKQGKGSPAQRGRGRGRGRGPGRGRGRGRGRGAEASPGRLRQGGGNKSSPPRIAQFFTMAVNEQKREQRVRRFSSPPSSSQQLSPNTFIKQVVTESMASASSAEAQSAPSLHAKEHTVQAGGGSVVTSPGVAASGSVSETMKRAQVADSAEVVSPAETQSAPRRSPRKKLRLGDFFKRPATAQPRAEKATPALRRSPRRTKSGKTSSMKSSDPQGET
jgi:hypothetical protein